MLGQWSAGRVSPLETPNDNSRPPAGETDVKPLANNVERVPFFAATWLTMTSELSLLSSAGHMVWCGRLLKETAIRASTPIRFFIMTELLEFQCLYVTCDL